MSEPVKVYAVVSGEYSYYTIHAIYRLRADAEARCKANNEATYWLLDGEPYHGDYGDLPHVEYRPSWLDTYDLRLGMVNEERKEPVVVLSDGRAWMTKDGDVAVFPDRLAGDTTLKLEPLPDGDYETAYTGERPSGLRTVVDDDRVKVNPAREESDDMSVEEFDYYEGEPTPAPVEGDA